ncbi:MAG: four helix bundle protein [Candidatus Marinimicrobia bacterium]|nr:four helix bundle protein [Candidatus Neomarinimicrobiota bacterium]
MVNSEKKTIKELSYKFALRIIKLVKILQEEKREFILSRQLMKSGTAIGALVREAQYAESSADFIHKLSIALKEANESEYWLSLLADSKYISKDKMSSLIEDNVSIIKM